jgi:hypothetical protein
VHNGQWLDGLNHSKVQKVQKHVLFWNRLTKERSATSGGTDERRTERQAGPGGLGRGRGEVVAAEQTLGGRREDILPSLRL